MILPFDFHVFAHEDGRYQTAQASASVSSSDRRVLEQFFFGQTNDAKYLASLSHDPGVIWRRVDNRFALTRVLKGKNDAQGRATLRFESVLIPPDAFKDLRLAELVRSEWRFGQGGVSCVAPAPAKRRRVNADKVSRIVLALRRSERIVLKSSGISLDDVERIVALCHDEPEFSLCYRSLNEHASVALNLVFGNVSEKRRMSQPPARRSGPARTLPRVAPRSRSAADTVVLAVAGLMLLMQVIVVFLMARGSHLPPDSDKMQESISRYFAKTSKELNDLREATEKTTDDLAELINDLDEQEAKLNQIIAFLGQMVSREGHEEAMRKLQAKLSKLQEDQSKHLGATKALVRKVKVLAEAMKTPAEAAAEIKDEVNGAKNAIEAIKADIELLMKTVDEIKSWVKPFEEDGQADDY